MKRYNLQLFANAVDGKRIAYLYRLLKDAATSDAEHVAFVTENGVSYSRDADSIETKDGAIRTPGAVEIEINTTSILDEDDEMITKLRNALVSGEKVEIWKINLAKPGTGQNKFKATYYQGYVTEFEETANAEDLVECSLTFGVEGTGADGEATVTELQQQLIAEYGFSDINKTGSSGA